MIIFYRNKIKVWKYYGPGDPGSDILLLIIIIIICSATAPGYFVGKESGASAPSHLVGKEYGATAPGYLH